MLAGKLFDIPVKGTHAHAYVTSFTGADDLAGAKIAFKVMKSDTFLLLGINLYISLDQKG